MFAERPGAHSVAEDAGAARAGRCSALAEYGQDHAAWRHGAVQQTCRAMAAFRSRVYMRLPPDLCYELRPAEPRLSHELPVQRDSAGERQHAAGLYERRLCEFDADAAYGQGVDAVLQTVVPVPRANMRPFSNTLKMQFIFLLQRRAQCTDTAPYNLKGAILKDSYLDIRGIFRTGAAAEPGDFSQMRAIRLRGWPTFPTRQWCCRTRRRRMRSRCYLTHDGTLWRADRLSGAERRRDQCGWDEDGWRKDYLVLGTVEDQPALSKLNPSLPVMVDGSGLHIQDTQGFFAPLQHAWWKVRSSDHIQSGQLETAGGLAGCAD